MIIKTILKKITNKKVKKKNKYRKIINLSLGEVSNLSLEEFINIYESELKKLKNDKNCSAEAVAKRLIKPLLIKRFGWDYNDLRYIEEFDAVSFALKNEEDYYIYVKVLPLEDNLSDLEPYINEALSKCIPVLVVTNGNLIRSRKLIPNFKPNNFLLFQKKLEEDAKLIFGE